MKLRKESKGGYDPDRCAGLGCNRESEMIDGTNRFHDGDVPFCSKCWTKMSDEYHGKQKRENPRSPEPKRIPKVLGDGCGDKRADPPTKPGMAKAAAPKAKKVHGRSGHQVKQADMPTLF